jgi:nicotinamidase-related amidase
MDSHHKWDISHPRMWCDDSGNSPDPFTGVMLDGDQPMFFNHVTGAKRPARARIFGMQAILVKYLRDLNAAGRYPHTIWPEHCLIGDEGHNIDKAISEAVHGWEVARNGMSDIVTKGSNPFTEHFSAVKAEVPDPKDPSTQINRRLIETLEKADYVVWVGEALSHCLANTFRDVVANFSDPSMIKKMWLCTDGSSNVPGFEHFGDDFIKEMKAKGMNLTTTVDFLA